MKYVQNILNYWHLEKDSTVGFIGSLQFNRICFFLSCQLFSFIFFHTGYNIASRTVQSLCSVSVSSLSVLTTFEVMQTVLRFQSEGHRLFG